MYKIINTERLVIRPITNEDKEFIYLLVNSDGWLKFIGDIKVSNSNDAENYIKKILNNSNYYYNVIELNETKQPIGIVTFLKRENYESPDFGFAILPEFESKGFAFEASNKYLEEVINENSYNKIIGITVSENLKSIKLLERLGFIFQNKVTENKQSLSIYKLNSR